MSYQELFQRYGRPGEEAELSIHAYFTKPENQITQSNIKYLDKSAAETIEQCKKTIERLQDYRQALAARYAQLETMAYKDRLEIERHPTAYRGIKYYVRIIRTFEDGKKLETLLETYDGKERHKALKRFEEIRKQRPGIEAVKNIERKSWERTQ